MVPKVLQLLGAGAESQVQPQAALLQGLTAVPHCHCTCALQVTDRFSEQGDFELTCRIRRRTDAKSWRAFLGRGNSKCKGPRIEKSSM